MAYLLVAFRCHGRVALPPGTRGTTMLRKLLALLVAMEIGGLVKPIPTSAQTTLDPATIAEMMDWWVTVGGPALQRALGHTGFRGPVPSVPVWIQNPTHTPITFYVQSEECEEHQAVYPPGEGGQFDCPGT